jgi:hypothetical protein
MGVALGRFRAAADTLVARRSVSEVLDAGAQAVFVG